VNNFSNKYIIFLLVVIMTTAIVSCISFKKSDVIVREPSIPGEATIEYSSPGMPDLPADLITNYLPMLKMMISPNVEKVTDDVYMAIGYDLGNIIMIITDDGLVIIDSSDSQDIAAHIMKDFRKITKKPVKYFIFTHFHPDHTNGGRSVVEDGTEVIATKEFLYWIDYQNNFLGQHHKRARTNQSGNAAPDYAFKMPIKSPVQIDRDKKPDVVMPTITFNGEYEFSLGGKKFVCIHAKGETEDQLIVWMPDEKILFPGDNYYHSFPNLSTPMLESRPVQGWISSLQVMIDLEPEIMVPQHSWPVIGAKDINEHLTNYRNAVKYVHDETVRCINEGKSVDEAVLEVRLPDHLAELPYLKENYGRVDWSVRGIYHGYKGWYSGDGTSLYPLPKKHKAAELVALSGGANNILARAIELLENKEYQLCMELCQVVLDANPNDKLAHQIKADAAAQQFYIYLNLNTFGFFRSSNALDKKAAAE
jgi:linear primary-alkylsulfatase